MIPNTRNRANSTKRSKHFRRNDSRITRSIVNTIITSIKDKAAGTIIRGGNRGSSINRIPIANIEPRGFIKCNKNPYNRYRGTQKLRSMTQ